MGKLKTNYSYKSEEWPTENCVRRVFRHKLKRFPVMWDAGAIVLSYICCEVCGESVPKEEIHKHEHDLHKTPPTNNPPNPTSDYEALLISRWVQAVSQKQKTSENVYNEEEECDDGRNKENETIRVPQPTSSICSTGNCPSSLPSPTPCPEIIQEGSSAWWRRKLFRCHVCSKPYSTFKETMKCVSSHGGSICKICFCHTSKGNKDKHRSSQHYNRDGRGLWHCWFCPETFKTEAQVKVHIGSYHIPLHKEGGGRYRSRNNSSS